MRSHMCTLSFVVVFNIGETHCWSLFPVTHLSSLQFKRAKSGPLHVPLAFRSTAQPDPDVSVGIEPCLVDKQRKLLSVVDDGIISSKRQTLSPAPVSLSPSWLNFDAIHHRVQQRHESDCMETHFAVERKNQASPGHSVEDPDRIMYEAVRVSSKNNRPDAHEKVSHFLGVRSTGKQPLLSEEQIDVIRCAAEQKWQRQKTRGEATSRFTYQRAGNYEAHIADLGTSVVEDIVNPILLNHLYPMIRSHFSACWKEAKPDGESGEDHVDVDDQYQLCVYDALYIRYNATEANLLRQMENASSGSGGAGQPLHRDLGLVSVNIMLNGANEFQGGGTFFESQLLPLIEKSGCPNGVNSVSKSQFPLSLPLKPVGVGHCLAHYSSERHAGASTQSGVRDILVIFITAKARRSTLSPSSRPPALIRNALLKQCRNVCEHAGESESGTDTVQQRQTIEDSIVCRISHLRLAVAAVPTDGEAYQYLGGALMDYASFLASSQHNDVQLTLSDPRRTVLQAAVEALEVAALLAPCDSRVYNNLGIALTRLSALQDGENRAYQAQIKRAYQRGRDLLRASSKVGCDVLSELNSLELNYGLYLSNQDDFFAASAVLERAARLGYHKLEVEPTEEHNDEDRVLHDALKLYRFCHGIVRQGQRPIDQ